MNTILVIEDDAAIRNNIAMILKSQGFVVLQAEDGVTGIELALGSSPDLIVCDIMLPEISGYEILTRLREEPDYALIPFIFLTALADRADMRQGMNLGADDYLTKPFTSQELLGAINTRLQKQQEITEPYRDEMRKAAENLRQMPYRDILTNLPNRIFFWQKIESWLQDGDTKKGALLLIKIANLAELTEELGQSVTDLLLQAMARALEALKEEKDVLSRCHTDAFGLLLTHHTDSNEAIESWLKPFFDVWLQPYPIANQSVNCDVKVAIAPFPLSGRTTSEWVGATEFVMNRALLNSVAPLGFYSPELRATYDVDPDKLQSTLQSGLANGEFELLYNPVVNLISGRVVSLDVIPRWNNPDFCDFPLKDSFVNAENAGEWAAFQEWFISTALQQFQQILKGYLSPLKLALPLPATHFCTPGWSDTFQQILAQADFDPNLLIVNLSESLVMKHFEVMGSNLTALDALGVQINLDEFGKGNASIMQMSQLPLDYLTISSALLQEVSDNPRYERVIKTIITMGQGLKLKVIMEGVETQEQLDFLRKQRCPLIQGSRYTLPLTFPEVRPLLDEERRLS